MTADIEVRSAVLPALPTDEGQAVFALMQQAIEKGGDAVDALERLVDLQERVARRRAELEFAGALVAFQQDCPVIPKSSTAKIVTKSGAGYEFKFADYEQIMETLRPHLAKHGFSPTFDADASGAMLKCTCTLHHRNGHSISSSFTLPTENASGATPQQKFGGALTYAKRMTLVAVLGLTLGEPDPEGDADPTPITAHQAANLEALITEVGADRAKFLAFMGVASVAEIRATEHDKAVRALEQKRRAAR